MPNALTSITNLINSPPGQLVAGGVLAGIVWKFFERVEKVLNDDTKLEMAVWLLGVRVGQKVEPWPDTFAKVFDRVFGVKHLTWRCFWRSCLASYIVFLVILFVWATSHHYGMSNTPPRAFVLLSALVFIGNAVPDYISLLETRFMLHAMSRTKSSVTSLLLLLIDLLMTGVIAAATVVPVSFVAYIVLDKHWDGTSWSNPEMWHEVREALSFRSFHQYIIDFESLFGSNPTFTVYWFYPAFFTSVWLWLYAGSGFLLKFARRFDIGFQWFNRHFDIEKKPLQSIGLVAGVLVAIVYWAAMIVVGLV